MLDHEPMSSKLPLPKYHQIYLVLREQLQEGHFANGLPGELALMQQFSVARVTVRRALELLQGEGLITREPGRGTRPLAPTEAGQGTHANGVHGNRAQLTGLLENLVSMGLRTSVKVLDVETVTASRAVAGALQIGVGDAVQKAVRVRSTREGPLSHITTYVPADIGRQLSTLADAYDVKLPRELVLIGKQFLYVERYMKLLAPKWQMMSDPQLTGYFANFMVEVSREHSSDV